MSADNQSPELKEYEGNCHCGNIKFKVKMVPPQEFKACDCSICTIHGYLWGMPFPKTKDIDLTIGSDGVTKYTFGSGKWGHKFCSNCGTPLTCGSVSDSPDPEEPYGVNLRTLKNFDITQMEPTYFKGSEIPGTYGKPDVPGYKEGTVQGELKQYKGSCHCGAVQYLVMHKPLEDVKVMSCNCSMCTRNAYLNIYPAESAVTIVQGDDAVKEYIPFSPDSKHCFCKTCGVSVFVRVTEPGEDTMPINVRTIHGADIQALKKTYYDGWSNEPQYSV